MNKIFSFISTYIQMGLHNRTFVPDLSTNMQSCNIFVHALHAMNLSFMANLSWHIFKVCADPYNLLILAKLIDLIFYVIDDRYICTNIHDMIPITKHYTAKTPLKMHWDLSLPCKKKLSIMFDNDLPSFSVYYQDICCGIWLMDLP